MLTVLLLGKRNPVISGSTLGVILSPACVTTDCGWNTFTNLDTLNSRHTPPCWRMKTESGIIHRVMAHSRCYFPSKPTKAKSLPLNDIRTEIVTVLPAVAGSLMGYADIICT